MSEPSGKKRYEKPTLTQVKLSVGRTVLQGCHGDFQNITGAGYDECYLAELCQKEPI
jgi:hypothetical protein